MFHRFHFLKTIENIVNSELNNILQWLCTNKLSVNLSKNNFIVFNRTKMVLIPNIHIDKHDINIEGFVRFLEILIDSCLT